MRRGSIVQLVVLGILFGAGAAAVALLIPWLPDPASEQADRIDFVFWFVTAICIAIFALVAAVIVYSIIHFRARPDDDEDGPPMHGNTGLEIVWTAVPAALVTAIAIVSAIVLAKNEHLPSASAAAGHAPARAARRGRHCAAVRLAVHVPGLPERDLRDAAPAARTGPCSSGCSALDVIHSFWVPEFGQKQDAVPGLVTKLVITPKRLGTFPVICTELCGLGHALMRSEAIVMDENKFVSWTKSQQGGGATGASGAGGVAPRRARRSSSPMAATAVTPSSRRAPRERSDRTSITCPTSPSRPGSRWGSSSGSRSSTRTPTSSPATRRA